MFIDKLQFLLLTPASLNQSPDRFKPKCIMCKGYLTGLVDTVVVSEIFPAQPGHEQ